MRIKNISPWGDLVVPLLDRVVEQGGEAEVDPAHAAILLQQEANFALVPEAPAAEATPETPAADAAAPATAPTENPEVTL